MDCSKSFQCEFDVEGWAKDDEKRDEEKSFEFGILGTDYDNWYVLYDCGEWWDGTGMMNTLAIYGKQEKISDEKLEEAKAYIAKKVPSFDLNPLFMKDGVQGSYLLGLGQCEYEWDHDQIELSKYED